jgi:hypothetical protein
VSTATAELGRAPLEDAKLFALSGNATFTVENAATGGRFTFRVSRPKGRDANDPLFVNVLRGPDNEADFAYLGCLWPRRGMEFGRTRGTKIGEEAPSMIVWRWLWTRINGRRELPAGVTVWHEGKCGACGRKLTVPDSIKSGLGPVCAGRV